MLCVFKVFGCFYSVFIFVNPLCHTVLNKNERGVGVKREEELHLQVIEVLGTAVMQVLVEQREPSREALIEMIQMLWQEEDVDLAVELAIDVLTLPKE